MNEKARKEKTLVCSISGQILSPKPEKNIPEEEPVRYAIRLVKPIICNFCAKAHYEIVEKDEGGPAKSVKVILSLKGVTKELDAFEAITGRDATVMFDLEKELLDTALKTNEALNFNIADIIARYHIKVIAMGRPSKQKDIQDKIQEFIKSLNYIIDHDEIKIETVNEDYTSVQSWEIMSNFKKNAAEDTISAMIILERWKDNKWEVGELN